jgi:translocation and assembly module TamA
LAAGWQESNALKEGLPVALALIGLLAGATPGLAQTAPPSPDPANPQAAPGGPTVDPELLVPLQPLDQFQVQTATPTAPAPPPTRITYSFKVAGLTAKGVAQRFRGLSSLRAGKGRAQSLEQAAARGREDAKTLETLLRSNGYYQAKAVVSLEAPKRPKTPAQVVISVDQGPLYRLGRVTVEGPATQPPGLAAKALGLKPGAPIVAPVIIAAEGGVKVRLGQAGYPFVKVGDHDVVLNAKTHEGDYTLPVDPGARSRFGSIIVAGKPVLPLTQLEVLPRFRPDQLYDVRLVDDLRRALMASGLYATVALTDVDQGIKTSDGADVVDIQVQGTQAKTHQFSGAIGYETGLGATAEIDWTDRNFAPPEGALTLRGLYGTQQSLAGLSFLNSGFGARDRNLQLLAQVSRETLDAYRADSAELTATLSRASTPIWQKVWTWSVGLQGELSQETGYDPSVAAETRRTYEIASLPTQFGYDRSDDLLNPTRGYRLSLQTTPELSIGAGVRPYVEDILSASAYQPVLKSLVLAGRVQLGGVFGAPVQDIAPSQRFYAGGGGSVRGYAYQGVGPKDPSGNPIGGVSSTLISVESRFRFGDYGFVAFLDGGEVYETPNPNFTNLRYGAGVGFRYFTGFGPLRFDIATPLGRRPGDAPLGVYISIGQTF